MHKSLLILLLLYISSPAAAQYDYLVLKKDKKTVRYFWKESRIAFQLNNQQWQSGIITKIDKDSFYFTVEKIHFTAMGADTTHFSGYHYALTDIYAIPKKGVKIDLINEQFTVNTSAGHQHWYWVKSGWIFRIGAIGYAALNLINSLRNKDFSSSGGQLGIAAVVFAGGIVLKKSHKITYRLGKKYQLDTGGLPRPPTR